MTVATSSSIAKRRVGRWAIAAGVLVVVAVGAYLGILKYQLAASREPAWGPHSGGTLLVCGGGVTPEVRECFVPCAGGAGARLVVLPTSPYSDGERSGAVELWRDAGIPVVDVIDVTSLGQADSPEVLARIDSATGVWIGGGGQSAFAPACASDAFAAALQNVLKRGGAIGGASAGAAVMRRVMIAGDNPELIEATGFDLLKGAVVDQHFFHRNRPQRLLSVLARRPELIGLGVDEQTAVVIQGDQWSVIGKSYAMVCLLSLDGPPQLEVMKAREFANIRLLQELPAGRAINSPAQLEAVLGVDDSF